MPSEFNIPVLIWALFEIALFLVYVKFPVDREDTVLYKFLKGTFTLTSAVLPAAFFIYCAINFS